MLGQTTRSDIRGRFSGSVLGLFWLLLYPLLFLGAYAGIFMLVYKVKYDLFDSNEAIVVIFCGLIPFLGFAEALGLGIQSVTSNANLIKNTMFPIELIPVKSVLVSQCTQVVGTGLLLIAVAIVGLLTPWALLVPVIWTCQVLFTIGVIWILASLNVYLRDLQNIVGVLTLILMIASPIHYTTEMLASAPAAFQQLLKFNPLYYIIMAYKDCLINGRFPQNTFWILLPLSVATFFVGHWFFSRMKRVFADNV